MREIKERDTLVEEAIKGLSRSIVLGKFPGIHEDALAKTINNSGTTPKLVSPVIRLMTTLIVIIEQATSN